MARLQLYATCARALALCWWQGHSSFAEGMPAAGCTADVEQAGSLYASCATAYYDTAVQHLGPGYSVNGLKCSAGQQRWTAFGLSPERLSERYYRANMLTTA